MIWKITNTALNLHHQAKDMLEVNGFSAEVVCFLLRNDDVAIKSLPLLATLANYSAKNIDPIYYYLKDLLVDMVAYYADQMNWRTFESFDMNTPNYPIIFYVDAVGMPQQSYHGQLSRYTNWRGKWSKVSVQEIAPKLLANWLKKQGQKNIWNLVLLTKNLMQVLGMEKADYLYNGEMFSFDINDQYLCRNSYVDQRSNDKLFQSFITYLSKKIKANQATEGDQNLDQSEAETKESETGMDSTLATGAESGFAQNSEVNAEESDLGLSGSGLPQEGNDLLGESQLPESNKSEIHNEGTDHDEVLKDADHLPSGNQIDADLEGSKRAASVETPNVIPTLTKDNKPSKSLFDALIGGGKKEGGNAGGGGDQLDTSKTATINPLLKDALLKLATGESLSQKEFGYQRWDAKKVLKSLVSNPKDILNAKFKRPAEKLFFSVDTSGSVAKFGNFILTMIKSAKLAENISLYSGSEAWPYKNEKTGIDYDSYSSIRRRKNHDFTGITFEVLQEEGFDSGTLVFWGDAEMSKSKVTKYIKLTKKYKCIWLYPYESLTKHRFGSNEVSKLQQAGFTVLMGAGNVSGFIKAINSIF